MATSLAVFATKSGRSQRTSLGTARTSCLPSRTATRSTLLKLLTTTRCISIVIRNVLASEEDSGKTDLRST